MPFVQRNSQGTIVALFAAAQPSAGEWLEPDDPQLHAFLGADASLSPQAKAFDGLDTDFIRVLEDVIDALIDKNVLRLTDLPVEAQRKLLARKGLRSRLRDRLDLLSGPDVI